jgi:chromosome segregation ATPase
MDEDDGLCGSCRIVERRANEEPPKIESGRLIASFPIVTKPATPSPPAAERVRGAPCDYCGTGLTEDGDIETATGSRHYVAQCREYVHAAMRGYRADKLNAYNRIAALEAELRDARAQLQGQGERTVWAVAEAASTTSRHERSIWERRVKEARALADAAEAEAKELRDDWRRGLRRAHDLTLETQTMEDAVTDLCRIVLQEREQKHAAEAEAERLRAAIAWAVERLREPTSKPVGKIELVRDWLDGALSGRCQDRQHADCETKREAAEAEAGMLRAELEGLREVHTEVRKGWGHALDRARVNESTTADLRAQLAARDALLAECVAMLERRSVVIEAARVAVMAAIPAPADTGHDMPMIRDMAAKALYDALIAWDGNEADDLVRRAGGKT